MAFSVLYAIKLYILLIITCSCVLAGTKSVWSGHANPYVLVRLKRSPNRAFTFSGFDPSNGLAAYATSADFQPYYQYPPAVSQAAYPPIQSRGETFAPASSALSAEYKPPGSDFKPANSNSELQPTADYTSIGGALDDEQKPLAQSLTPPGDQAPNGSFDINPASFNTRKAKKKPTYVAPAGAGGDDDEDEVGNSKTRSSSSASFNAWFPIVLGMYPSAGQSGRSAAAESLKEGSGAAAVKDQREPVPAGGLGTTVIANSVSHGKSSVASSHAIAYGGDAPSRSQPYRNKG